MNTIVVPEADALDALARIYPADAQILWEASTKLRNLSSECQRLRDFARVLLEGYAAELLSENP